MLTLDAQVKTNDSLSIQLKEVVVEADQQNISASVSTYFPTLKQKNASQSGIDLLNRMAIPQLALGAGTKINTVSSKPVGVFIDWLPASTDDLKNMRTTDVKKVEYYDYPSDPRFLGNAHVVNFGRLGKDVQTDRIGDSCRQTQQIIVAYPESCLQYR